MTTPRPTTIAEYINAAQPAGQPHLRHLHALLKRAAPDAQEAIKWGTPFFIEPRFVYAFSAHKAHCSFIREMAEHSVRLVRERTDDAFW